MRAFVAVLVSAAWLTTTPCLAQETGHIREARYLEGGCVALAQLSDLRDLDESQGALEGRNVGTKLGSTGDLVDIEADTKVEIRSRRQIDLRKLGSIEVVRVVAPREAINGSNSGKRRASRPPGYWVMDSESHPYVDVMPSVNCLRDSAPPAGGDGASP